MLSTQQTARSGHAADHQARDSETGRELKTHIGGAIDVSVALDQQARQRCAVALRGCKQWRRAVLTRGTHMHKQRIRVRTRVLDGQKHARPVRNMRHAKQTEKNNTPDTRFIRLGRRYARSPPQCSPVKHTRAYPELIEHTHIEHLPIKATSFPPISLFFHPPSLLPASLLPISLLLSPPLCLNCLKNPPSSSQLLDFSTSHHIRLVHVGLIRDQQRHQLFLPGIGARQPRSWPHMA